MSILRGHKARTPEGAALADLPADIRVQKFEVAVDDYVLKVDEWLGEWKWSIWTSADVSFGGRAKTPAECIERGYRRRRQGPDK